ncbi:hypothetical protein ACROYT_G021799 [Oculina patagonica]
MTPRDGGFSKRPKLYISSLKLAGFAGSGVDISFKLRGGISTRAPKIVIFNTSRSSFLFDSFGRGVKIKMNPRDGVFSKNPKLYISSLTLAGFAGSGVKISFILSGGISKQALKILIFNDSSSTFLFDSFGPGIKIKMNPRDGGFSKRTKLYISSLKLAGFAGSGVKISFNLHGGISTQRPKSVIFNGSCSTFKFDSFGPGVKIKINQRDGGFAKSPKRYISSLKLAVFAVSGVKISFKLRCGDGVKIGMNPRDGGFSKSPKLYISSLKLAGFAVSGVKISFKLRGGDGVKIGMNPRDGGFSKSPKLYISSLKLAGFAVSGVKISFKLRGGIAKQGPKIVIFSGSCITFLFDSSGDGVKIGMNPRDGGFSKSPKLYISSLKLAGFAVSGVKISFKLRGGIAKQGPKIVIFNDSCSTFLFDTFGPEVKIKMTPRDGGFSKRPKLYISTLKLAGFAGSGVDISFKLRGGISTRAPKIVIFNTSRSSFLFDSFGRGVKIKMNPRDGVFSKNPKLYISSLTLAGFAGSGVKISFILSGGISNQALKILIFNDSSSTFLFDSFGPGNKIKMNPRDGGFSKRPKLYISSLKLAGFAGSGVKISFNLHGGISTQRPKSVIFNGSCSTFKFDSFGPGVKIKINQRDGGFSKRPKLYISSLKLAGYAVSGVKISFKLRGALCNTRAQNRHFQWLMHHLPIRLFRRWSEN